MNGSATSGVRGGSANAPWLSLLIGALRPIFSRRTPYELAYLVAGCVLGACGLGCLVVLLVSVPLSVTFLGPLPVWAALRGAGTLAGQGRRLAEVLLGRRIDPPPRRVSAAVPHLFRAALGDPVDWRALAYLLWKVPYSLLCGVLMVANIGWAFGFASYPVRAVVTHVTERAANGTPRGMLLAGIRFDTWPLVILICLAGLVWLLATPWLIHVLVVLDVGTLRYLTGSSPAQRRVHDLEVSRARVVDDAAATLRQIERNLHDGAQARMVAVAMTLGQARKELARQGIRSESGIESGPESAAEPGTEVGAGSRAERGTESRADQSPENARLTRLLAAAHEDAKLAIAELRELASGIHPPILDSGLDAALASLVDVAQLPVRLDVDLATRPAEAIETIAYFCASELLANVAKHSGAAHAEVSVRQSDDCLELRVSDDGVGNADASAGSGLRGLLDRVGAVDGTLTVDSPPGGPTIVTIVLPIHV